MYNFKGKLDDKNRLTIPAEVRRELEGNDLYITPGFNATLHLYPNNIWRDEMESAIQVKTNPEDKTPTILNQQLAAQADYFLSDLQVTRVDGRGRITLDPDLVSAAGFNELKDWKAVRVTTDTGSYWRIRRADRRPQI